MTQPYHNIYWFILLYAGIQAFLLVENGQLTYGSQSEFLSSIIE